MGGGQRTGSGSSPPSAAQRPAAKSAVITRRRSSLASHAATRPPDGSTHPGAVPHPGAVRRRARDPTLQSCPRSATQRDSHPSRPLGRLQRSGDCGLAMRCEFRHRIAAPAPKQIMARTHRPPTVDQISVLPHARPSGNVNGSQPTVTIADKYKPGVLIETSERRCGGQK